MNLILFFHKLIVPLYFHYSFHSRLLILLQSLIYSASASFYTFFSLPHPRHQSLELFCLLTTTVALHMYTSRFPLATWPQDAKQSVPLLSARASLSFTFTPKQRVTGDGSKSRSTNPPYTPALEGNSSCCFLLSRGSSNRN